MCNNSFCTENNHKLTPDAACFWKRFWKSYCETINNYDPHILWCCWIMNKGHNNNKNTMMVSHIVWILIFMVHLLHLVQFQMKYSTEHKIIIISNIKIRCNPNSNIYISLCQSWCKYCNTNRYCQLHSNEGYVHSVLFYDHTNNHNVWFASASDNCRVDVW